MSDLFYQQLNIAFGSQIIFSIDIILPTGTNMLPNIRISVSNKRKAYKHHLNWKEMRFFLKPE